jgi:hypothetical protein
MLRTFRDRHPQQLMLPPGWGEPPALTRRPARRPRLLVVVAAFLVVVAWLTGQLTSTRGWLMVALAWVLVLNALRRPSPPQTADQLADVLAAHGRRLRLSTVTAALARLEAAKLAARTNDDGQLPRWAPVEPEPRETVLADLELHGPHDLRHTFATWLEDAGIPSRVIDELMGHASGQRRDGSAIGPRYRHTAPEMEARAVAAIEQRLALALKVSSNL